MTALDVVLEVFVPGHPKTKGSLEKQGGRMVESVAGSKTWRRLVAQRARDVAGGAAPIVGPVAVRLAFYLPVIDVWVGRPGDIDKLARNVLDALGSTDPGDAAVYGDDAQVVRLIAEKYSARPYDDGALILGNALALCEQQGVLIQVWRMPG